MANRLFDLQETKGTFQVVGVVNGVSKEQFYTDKKTTTNKDFRAVNFGCEYDEKKSVYVNLSGIPQQEVYFSKRNQDGKTETKKVPWLSRNKFNEDGFRMIGVNLGLTKTVDKSGKAVNDKKTMHAFDACSYINENLKDDASVFVKGNIEFSSFSDKDGNLRRGIKYVPNQISLCQEVDFSKYDYVENKPKHNFTQVIVFTGIEKEKESDKDTGRFVVSAKIVTYSDIVDTEFYITDAKLAGLFKKNLKPYQAIEVHGKIEMTHVVEEVEDDGWGEANEMKRVNQPSKTEMIITGADPHTIDKDTYTEKNVAEAIQKVRNAKQAEQNFSGTTNTSTDSEVDGWGEDNDADDDEIPW